MKISIAIDGPAGAGKSTIAKILSDKFNLMYINTGFMYRAVTLFALKNNVQPNDIESLCKLINSLDMKFINNRLIVNDVDVTNEIILPEISKNVSNYAAVPEVREKLVDLQKKISKKYNVIMDGRDIGTVVLKDAPFKFYLNASPEERAKRRFNELINKGIKVEYNNILDDIIKRDYIDTHRKTNPLYKASDAIEIDSSNLTIEQVVNKIYHIINSKL
ncbi:cytidylate kinase [Clostridium acetireducens DSM 10703]|jgi:cytidylate kinase|uniref:Cytidylate kinase n=1 Tax=Clostridium acetireducens DSM 10703 TaxID=1121290 RepID=A0A1E8F344_9CLOT|nr:(d)CMP kinase [Clostridium acetireducens]OFI07768.1 cytidylate kinase [Clostridium acetireducens DSM 10703]